MEHKWGQAKNDDDLKTKHSRTPWQRYLSNLEKLAVLMIGGRESGRSKSTLAPEVSSRLLTEVIFLL